MDGYDFAGIDQQTMAPMLACINQIMQSVVAAYSALKKIIKVDGQPGNELAQQILATAKPAFEDLIAKIGDMGQGRHGESELNPAS